MHRILLPALAVMGVTAALAAPAQGQVVGFDDILDYGVDATTVGLCWSEEDADRVPSWEIRAAAGTEPPPDSAAPVATAGGGSVSPCQEVGGLETDQPYTFLVTGTSDEGRPYRGVWTAAARVPGTFVRTAEGTSSPPRSGDYGGVALSTADPSGRVTAAFMSPAPKSNGYAVWTSSRKPGGEWSEPYKVSPGFAEYPAATGNAAGMVAVGFGFHAFAVDPPGWRIGPAAGAYWSKRARVPIDNGNRYDAIVMDRVGHLHLLVAHYEPDASRSRLDYWTNATGRWTRAEVPAADVNALDDLPTPAGTGSTLGYDPVTDRVLVAVRTKGGVRVAGKAPAARAFGALHAVEDAPKALDPTSISGRGGRLALGLVGPAGAYVATGGSAATMAPPVLLPDGDAGDTVDVRVATASRTRVRVAWQRGTALEPLWDEARQGIWMATRAKDRKGGWTFREPAHVSASAYDRLYDLDTDPDGRPVLGHQR